MTSFEFFPRALRVIVVSSLLALAGSALGCGGEMEACETGEDAGASRADAGQGAGDGGGTFDAVWKPAAPMHAKRGKHAAVKLPDGRVLVAGPPANAGPFAEIYDPNKDAWTDVAPPRNPMTCPPVMAALGDGRALLAFNGFAEVYSPGEGTWKDVTPAGPLSPSGYTGCESEPAYFLVTPKGNQNPVLILPDAVWELDVATDELLPRTPPPDPATVEQGVSVEGAAVAAEPSDGTVLVAGGFGYCQQTQRYTIHPDGSDAWAPGATMAHCHVGGAAVGVHPYFGTLVAGGESSFGAAENAGVEVFDGASWTSPVPMAHPRSAGHTATLLPSGQVLVIGGSTSSTAEVFDPNARAWRSLESEGALRFSRHASTLLDDGRVLVTGGQLDAAGSPFEPESDRSFLCTPSSSLWRAATPLPPLDELAGAEVGSPAPVGRLHHTATRLPDDGGVLVAGGGAVSSQFIVRPDGLGTLVPLRSALSYDPQEDLWQTRGAMSAARVAHEAALLGDGRVLVVGGDGFADPAQGWTATASTVEIFAPKMDGWSKGPPLPAPPPEPGDEAPPQFYVGLVRAPGSTAWTRTGALLPLASTGARVLLLASRIAAPGASPTELAALFFEPDHDGWTAAPTPLHAGLVGYTATLIPGASGSPDRVLVAGGVAPQDGSTPISAYLFDAVGKTWTPTKGGLLVPRLGHTATRLPARLRDGEIVEDGRILVVGGRAAKTFFTLTECELYDPRDDSFRRAAPLAQPRWGHQAIVLDDTGQVLVVGGAQSDAVTVDSAELYDPGTDTWTHVQNLADARWGHSLTSLGDGSALAAGGANYISSSLASVERFAEQLPGRPCAFDTDCAPDATTHVGRCVEGLCCDSPCDDACHACSIARGASQDGHCEDVSVARCGALACDVDTGCKPCSTEGDCVSGLVCNPEGQCVKPPPRHCDAGGTACSTRGPAREPGGPLLLGLVVAVCALAARRRGRGRRPRAARGAASSPLPVRA